MNSKTGMSIIALTLFAALALPVSLAAQDQANKTHPHQYHHYQIADPGTFGGPSSHQNFSSFVQGNLNNRGAFAPGAADTSIIDPLCYNNPPDCYANEDWSVYRIRRARSRHEDLGLPLAVCLRILAAH